MLKRLIRSSAGSFLLSVTLAAIMGSLVASLRWRHTGRAELQKRLNSGKPEIIVFWHEHLFVMSPVLPNRLFCFAITPSRRAGSGRGITFIRPETNLGQQQPKCPVRTAPNGSADKSRAFSRNHP